jgi:hypothetical protein
MALVTTLDEAPVEPMMRATHLLNTCIDPFSFFDDRMTASLWQPSVMTGSTTGLSTPPTLLITRKRISQLLYFDERSSAFIFQQDLPQTGLCKLWGTTPESHL